MYNDEQEFEKKKEIEKTLYKNGVVDFVKSSFSKLEIIDESSEKTSSFTIETYYILIADYIYSILSPENNIIYYFEAVNLLKDLLKKIVEKDFNRENIGDKASYIDGGVIYINRNLPYKMQKLAIFKELTTLLFEKKYYNSEPRNRDYFIRDGIIQHTYEKLVDISNDVEAKYDYYEEIGLPNHKIYGNLRENNLNKDILILLSLALGQNINKVSKLGFTYNGRKTLSDIYQSQKGNRFDFDELMSILDKISLIKEEIGNEGKDGLEYPHSFKVMETSDNKEFIANLELYNDLVITVERELMNMFLYNRTNNEIMENYELFMKCLTTEELKEEFRELIRLEFEEIEELDGKNRKNQLG